MGYYTNYELEIKPMTPPGFEEHFKEVTDYDFDSLDNCKWYDHLEDMSKLSAEYPNYFFILKGEGEEAGDLWVDYYYRGNAQTTHANIVYDEPDFIKLGNPELHSPEIFI